MKFSARSQYAIEAMLALVPSQNGQPIQVRHISRDHGIPVRFLEQIMASLKKAGLVNSIRGARGGYLLGAAPDSIHVGDIIQAVEGAILDDPLKSDSTPPATLVVHGLWIEAQEVVQELFARISLETLMQRKEAAEGQRSLMYHI